MGNIKILKKLTNEEYSEIKKEFKLSETSPLRISLQDLGFCIKNELNEKDQKRWDEIQAWMEDNVWGKAAEKAEEGTEGEENSGSIVIKSAEMPEDMEKDRKKLRKKIYSNFKFIAPGYMEETMEWAKNHNSDLYKPIPKGARLYYTYPLSCVVVAETTDEITTSADFVEAFCEGYQEIYRLEEDSSTKKAMPICEENPESSLMNRNSTDGCFGIWGHDIGDLVLEVIKFWDGGKHITFEIGS